MRVLLALFLLLKPISTLEEQPLNLDWSNKHSQIIEVSGYRYFFGDVNYGTVVYTSTADILGLVSELQLYYSSKKLAKVLLILGPAGLNEHNCLDKHKLVVKLLNEKYGHYKYRKIRHDDIANDLFYSSPCKIIRESLHEITTVWLTKKYKIVSVLIGDDDGFYVEIEYINLFLNPKRDKHNKKKVMRKF